jgi:hypothetical protein
MPWLSILLMIIQAVPDVIKAIKALIDLLKKAPKEQKRELAAELKAACETLAKTGDRKPFERIRAKIQELLKKD